MRCTGPDSLPIVADADGRDIAWVRDGYDEMGKYLSPDEVAANARLIAAAPKMLRLIEARHQDSFFEDDRNADFLVYACVLCDAAAKDDPFAVKHKADCEVAELAAVIKAVRGEAVAS